ncbi:MAG: hypothetical protein OXF02_05530 [Simkaniaceae bacterium]|nr:hypothetical protein [Simkaniaceae bacterium]
MSIQHTRGHTFSGAGAVSDTERRGAETSANRVENVRRGAGIDYPTQRDGGSRGMGTMHAGTSASRPIGGATVDGGAQEERLRNMLVDAVTRGTRNIFEKEDKDAHQIVLGVMSALLQEGEEEYFALVKRIPDKKLSTVDGQPNTLGTLCGNMYMFFLTDRTAYSTLTTLFHRYRHRCEASSVSDTERGGAEVGDPTQRGGDMGVPHANMPVAGQPERRPTETDKDAEEARRKGQIDDITRDMHTIFRKEDEHTRQATLRIMSALLQGGEQGYFATIETIPDGMLSRTDGKPTVLGTLCDNMLTLFMTDRGACRECLEPLYRRYSGTRGTSGAESRRAETSAQGKEDVRTRSGVDHPTQTEENRSIGAMLTGVFSRLFTPTPRQPESIRRAEERERRRNTQIEIVTRSVHAVFESEDGYAHRAVFRIMSALLWGDEGERMYLAEINDMPGEQLSVAHNKPSRLRILCEDMFTLFMTDRQACHECLRPLYHSYGKKHTEIMIRDVFALSKEKDRHAYQTARRAMLVLLRQGKREYATEISKIPGNRLSTADGKRTPLSRVLDDTYAFFLNDREACDRCLETLYHWRGEGSRHHDVITKGMLFLLRIHKRTFATVLDAMSALDRGDEGEFDRKVAELSRKRPVGSNDLGGALAEQVSQKPEQKPKAELSVVYPMITNSEESDVVRKAGGFEKPIVTHSEKPVVVNPADGLGCLFGSMSELFAINRDRFHALTVTMSFAEAPEGLDFSKYPCQRRSRAVRLL